MIRKVLMLVFLGLLATLSPAQNDPPRKSVTSGQSSFPDKKLMQQIMDAWATMDPPLGGFGGLSPVTVASETQVHDRERHSLWRN